MHKRTVRYLLLPLLVIALLLSGAAAAKVFLPYKKVSFWVGVGEKDNVADDVARAWDPYIGNTRLDRAWAFAAALNAFGAREEMHVYPNQGHADLPGNRDAGLAFLLSTSQTGQ